MSIVEDEAGARDIISSWIKRAEGFRLMSTYGSAERALAGLPREKPDVVLTDTNLPGMDGVECV